MVFGGRSQRAEVAEGARPRARPVRSRGPRRRRMRPLGRRRRSSRSWSWRRRVVRLLRRQPAVLLRGHQRRRPRDPLPGAALRPALRGRALGRSSTRRVPALSLIPESRRDRVLDHQLRGKGDAVDLVQAGRARALARATDDLRARTRELLGLLPVSLLVTAGFTAVLITRSEVDEHGDAHLRRCSSSAAACSAHLFIRARLPDADPYLFPLAALLAAFGLVMIYRIDQELAREQAQWFVRRPAAVLRDDRLPARLPRARALPLHDRRARARAAARAAPARDRQRRSTARSSR